MPKVSPCRYTGALWHLIVYSITCTRMLSKVLRREPVPGWDTACCSATGKGRGMSSRSCRAIPLLLVGTAVLYSTSPLQLLSFAFRHAIPSAEHKVVLDLLFEPSRQAE